MATGLVLMSVILGLSTLNFNEACDCEPFDAETAFCVYDIALEAKITGMTENPERYTFETIQSFANEKGQTADIMIPASDCGMDIEVGKKYIAFGYIIRDNDRSRVLVTSCRYGSVSETDDRYSDTLDTVTNFEC